MIIENTKCMNAREFYFYMKYICENVKIGKCGICNRLTRTNFRLLNEKTDIYEPICERCGFTCSQYCVVRNCDECDIKPNEYFGIPDELEEHLNSDLTFEEVNQLIEMEYALWLDERMLKNLRRSGWKNENPEYTDIGLAK